MSTMSTIRTRSLTLLAIVSFVITLVTTLLVFAQDRIFDADSFSTTTASTLSDPAVNEYLADEVSEALIDQVPDMAIAGPLVAEVSGAVLHSDPAIRVVETSAREAHKAIFDRSEGTLVLELSDLVVSIDQALTAVNPELASTIPDEVSSLSVEIGSSESFAATVRLAKRLRTLTYVLVPLSAVLLIALVALDASLFRGLARMGAVLGLTGLLLVVLRGIGAAVVASYGRSPLESDALAGAWNVVFGDLATWGWVLIALGAFSAGIGWAVGHAGRVDASLRQLLARLTAEPTSRLGRAARILAILGFAGWALVTPGSLIEASVRVAGFALLLIVIASGVEYLGIAERLKALAPEPGDVVPLRSVAVRSVVPVLMVLGLGVVGATLLSHNDNASAIFDPAACNGHVELCDRPLDQVTMAAAHNAMSSTATGFYLPNQLSTIRAQLDYGVRALLIDTVYGRPAGNGSVRTSLSLVEDNSLDSAALSTAKAIRADQGSDLGEEAVYLCHSYCEIGALKAEDTLRSLRSWLDDHPSEVVILVVQDATSPQDTAAVFERAGFADIVHSQAIDAPFPTLGEMIDSGRRVFIMVEEDPGDIEWLHPAFEFSQETPYSFASVEEFSCAPNRGNADSPLFIVNHFITLARPSNQDINDRDVLEERAIACEEERGRLPNLLAVDFVTKGEVMEVVDDLNGVG